MFLLTALLACGTGAISLVAPVAPATPPCAEGYFRGRDGNCYPESEDSDSGGDTSTRETGIPDTGPGEDTGPDTEDTGVETGDSEADTEDTGADTEDTGEPAPGAYNEMDVVAVEVGILHYCAMDSWGYVSCSSDGIPEFEVPAELSAVTFTDIAVNSLYSCGIREDDLTVECWGDAPSIGAIPSSSFTAIASIADDLSTFFDFSCGITVSGAVECWGDEDEIPEEIGEVPAGASDLCLGGYGASSFICTQSAEDGTVGCLNMGLDESLDEAGSSAAIIDGSLSCGSEQACGILDDGLGTIDCWGIEWESDGVAVDSYGTVVGPFTGSYTAVSAGPHWNCAATSSGAYECFGNSLSERDGANEEIWTSDNAFENPTLATAAFSNLSVSDGGGCGVDTQYGSREVNCWGYHNW